MSLASVAEALLNLPPDHPRLRMLTGQTPFFASSFDQRFSFALYVPKTHSFSGPDLPVLVAIHGTRRRTGVYLNQMKQFSERHGCVIFVPLFAAGIDDPTDIHNYKGILYRDIRFDLVLLSMLDQAEKIWRIRTDKVHMHGFSGGGQFAHRFFYLHPHRLASISIGAPGFVTSPNTQHAWPIGLGDVHEKFGLSGVPDFEAMARVPVKMVVGEEDLDTSMLKEMKSSDGAGEEGCQTRVDRIKWLQRAWKDVGVSSELTILPKVGHNGGKFIPVVEEWLIRHLSQS